MAPLRLGQPRSGGSVQMRPVRENGRHELKPVLALCVALVVAASSLAATDGTNTSTATNGLTTTASSPPSAGVAASTAAPSRGPEESAFRIIAERNIFNANRSGGQVRLASSRRPARVESFTLVGTLAYAKGAFAFFSGSSSEYSKALPAGGIIAGYKLVDVLANSVKLEADGQIHELPVGSAMRREDDGPWRLGEGVAVGGAPGFAAVREAGFSSRAGRRDSSAESAFSNADNRADLAAGASPDPPAAKELKPELKLDAQTESEILKRLMERRERESQ